MKKLKTFVVTGVYVKMLQIRATDETHAYLEGEKALSLQSPTRADPSLQFANWHVHEVK